MRNYFKAQEKYDNELPDDYWDNWDDDDDDDEDGNNDDDKNKLSDEWKD